MILVDGNSKDETVEAARHAYPGYPRLHPERPRQGRRPAHRLRRRHRRRRSSCSTPTARPIPAEIPRFVDALEAGADFAKGSRFLPGGGSADITRLRKLGNALLSGTANVLHGTHFTDLCYGYNAFWARCLPFISLDVPGFEVETLINLRIAGAGHEDHRGPELRGEPDLTGRAT